MHKYFPEVECPCALCIGSLSYCQSAVLATVAKMAQVEVRTAPYFLFVTAGMDYVHAQKFTESCLLCLELVIEASTRVATMAQKLLPTAVINRKTNWWSRFSASDTAPYGLNGKTFCCVLQVTKSFLNGNKRV